LSNMRPSRSLAAVGRRANLAMRLYRFDTGGEQACSCVPPAASAARALDASYAVQAGKPDRVDRLSHAA